MKTNNNFTILIVDDEKFNIELVAIYLQEEGYNVAFATSGKSALEGIETRKIDLILLDINMPIMDGFDVCKILKKDPKTKDIPVIFLTAQHDVTFISKAFEVGGVDYITKPFNAIELKARVKTHLQNIKYLQEIQKKQAKFAQLSITDSLTKLYNGLYFDSQVKIYQNHKEEFWIFYIALDRFDKINSLYGYYKANKLLRLFAKSLQSSMLSNAVVARLHGVHFAVLLKGYEFATIQNIYKKMFQTFDQHQEIAQNIHFHTIICEVKTTSTPLATIYKRLQEEIDNIKESRTSSKIITL